MTTKAKKTARKPKPLRGKALLRAAVNQIIAHPETWNQESYHCGTKHCVAGWCQVLAGRTKAEIEAMEWAAGRTDCADDAQSLADLTTEDANYLFDGNRSLAEIHKRTAELLGVKPKVVYLPL